MEIWDKHLTRRDFDKYAIWCWIDDEGFRPVVKTKPFPAHLQELYMRAIFTAASGEQFEGYIVTPENPEVFCLFCQEHAVIICIRSFLSLHVKEIDILSQVMPGSRVADLFPLSYKTEFGYPEGTCYSGVFRLENDSIRCDTDSKDWMVIDGVSHDEYALKFCDYYSVIFRQQMKEHLGDDEPENGRRPRCTHKWQE